MTDLTEHERIRIARMLREHARSQRRVADEMEAANPGDLYAGLMNHEEASDAEMLADKVAP